MSEPVSLVSTLELGAAFGTLAVAVMVFVEARRIRRADWITRQNQAWNDLGNAVADIGKGSRIAELLLGQRVEPPLSAKESFLLMSFFNVVSSEYHGYRAHAIERRYVLHSLTMTTRVVAANKDWVFGFLREYGYESTFIRGIAITVVIGEDIRRRDRSLRRELAASSDLARFCGKRYRAWLRREFDNAEIDTLCGLPAD